MRFAPAAARTPRALFAPAALGGRRKRTLVHRPFFGQRVRGNFGGHFCRDAARAPGHPRSRDRFPPRRVPTCEHCKHFLFAAALGHQQHALLRFAEHHFVRRHARFALRHARELDLNAQPAARRHLARGAREPGRAHVLNRDDRAGLHRFEARLEQQLFHERIADLHVGPLLLRFFA